MATVEYLSTTKEDGLPAVGMKLLVKARERFSIPRVKHSLRARIRVSDGKSDAADEERWRWGKHRRKEET